MHSTELLYFVIKYGLPLRLSWYSACNVGGRFFPGLGRSSGEGKSYPLQYSGLENSMGWKVHGVAKSQTLSLHFKLDFLLGIEVSRKHSYIAAAKSLQLCPTLCNPIDGSPPGSPVPGIFQARTLEWVAIPFSNAWKWKVKVKSLSHVRLLATPWTAAYQAPPPMGFSREEY